MYLRLQGSSWVPFVEKQPTVMEGKAILGMRELERKREREREIKKKREVFILSRLIQAT